MPGRLVIAANRGLRTAGRMRAPVESQCSLASGGMATICADNAYGDRYMTFPGPSGFLALEAINDGTHERRSRFASPQTPISMLASGHARDGPDHGPFRRFCAGGAER